MRCGFAHQEGFVAPTAKSMDLSSFANVLVFISFSPFLFSVRPHGFAWLRGPHLPGAICGVCSLALAEYRISTATYLLLLLVILCAASLVFISSIGLRRQIAREVGPHGSLV